MPTIKALRASSIRCNVTVNFGVTDIGTPVTVDIILDRTKQEVKDAFATLENLALREAQTAVGQAVNRDEVDKRAAEKASKLVDAANARTRKNVRSALVELKHSVQRMSGTDAARAMRERVISEIDNVIDSTATERKAG